MNLHFGRVPITMTGKPRVQLGKRTVYIPLSHGNTSFFKLIRCKDFKGLDAFIPAVLSSVLFSKQSSTHKYAHTHIRTHFLSSPSLNPDLLPCFNSGNSSLHFVGGLLSFPYPALALPGIKEIEYPNTQKYFYFLPLKITPSEQKLGLSLEEWQGECHWAP